MSLLLNTAWYAAGNASAAAAQFLVVLFLGRFGDAGILGQYSLALAICSPAFLFSECKLREVFAGDASGRFAEQEYFMLRISTATLLAGSFVLGGIFLPGMEGFGKTIAAMGMWKGFDSVADIGYGWFQRRRRMREIGLSMTLRNAAALIALVTGLTLLKDLTSGILLAAVGSGLVFIKLDLKAIRISLGMQARGCDEPWAKWPALGRLGALFRSAAPLGAVAGLTSLRVAVPKYFVGAYLGQRALGYFTAAYALPAIGTVLVSSFGQALLPQIAEAYNRRMKAVLGDIMRAMMGVSSIACAGILVSVFFGGDLLCIIYGSEYKKVHFELVGLSVAVGLTFACSILGISLTAIGAFRAQVPIYISTVLIVALGCVLLIPLYGLLGAVYAMILSAAVWLALSLRVLKCVLAKQNV